MRLRARYPLGYPRPGLPLEPHATCGNGVEVTRVSPVSPPTPSTPISTSSGKNFFFVGGGGGEGHSVSPRCGWDTGVTGDTTRRIPTSCAEREVSLPGDTRGDTERVEAIPMGGKKSNNKGRKPSTSGPSVRAEDIDAAESAKRPQVTSEDSTPTNDGEKPRKGLHGVPGSKNPERRCTAKSQRTGERCKAAAIKGGTVCRVHGGAAKQVQKAAKERLQALVDPALTVLHRILTDPNTDDAVKVRAALGTLDRAGFRPGVVVEVEPGDKWSALLDGATMVDNRALGGAGAADELKGEAALQLALDAREESWKAYDAEDAAEYDGRPSFRDENTITGAVVKSRYDVPPTLGPTDPPRWWPDDARRGDA